MNGTMTPAAFFRDCMCVCARESVAVLREVEITNVERSHALLYEKENPDNIL